MAVFKCALKGGKLEVLEVLEFRPGDKIKFDKPVPFFVEPDDCLIVRSPFRSGRTVEKHWVEPCPGNKPA
jgi:hypothetical protein